MGCDTYYVVKNFITKVELSQLSPVSQKLQIEQYSEISGSVKIDYISHFWLSSEARGALCAKGKNSETSQQTI